MKRLALVLFGLGLLASPAAAKQCRDASGRFVKCPQPAPTPTPTPTPAPAPTGGYVLSPTLTGLPAIPSTFDPLTKLEPSWGTGAIAPSAAPDVVGAFRFICEPTWLLYDDPILYPGQPGKSHLHQGYGEPSGNAFSTYESLRRASAGTHCGGPVNNSLYWMPAMLDGKGHVVRPDYVTIYYKRRPASDPIVSDPAHPQYMGKAVPLPNGLRFIFGWDPTGINSAKTGAAYFNCDGPGATQGHYANIAAAAQFCPAGSRIGAIINAPSCWNGKDLDTPDHRSHVAYPDYGWWGYLKCPATHPYVIPTFTMGAWYSVEAGDELVKRLADGSIATGWYLSSDHMLPGAKPGETYHADWFGAWDPVVLKMWNDNCIDRKLNCSGGDLGNGKQIRDASQPRYGWKNPNRLVPVPPAP